jgi:hypothetical protein
MPWLPVTFLTVAAHSVSHARNAKGQLLGYELIVGVKVGKDSAVFKHPDYDLYVNPGARPGPQKIMMPSLMAARLLPFIRYNLIPEDGDYDSLDFALYMAGLQPTPVHNTRPKNLRITTDEVRSVGEMHYHAIHAASNNFLHAFIGLSNQRALSVHGLRGPFGIAQAQELVRAYGGTRIGQLKTL